MVFKMMFKYLLLFKFCINIWKKNKRYGFASNPQLIIVATPIVGEKEVTYAAISDWIAEKLKLEFQVF